MVAGVKKYNENTAFVNGSTWGKCRNKIVTCYSFQIPETTTAVCPQ